jgi:hypothetical protein
MNPRRTLAAVAAASALALVAGCGTAAVGGRNDSSAPPKTELEHSVQALSKGKALTATVSLDTTAAQILHLANMGGGSDGPTPAQAQAIAGAHITVEMLAPKGETLAQAKKNPAKSSLALTIGTGSTTYLAVRSIGGSIYAQLDLKGFLTLFGSAKEYASLQAESATLPPFANAFVAGKWVSISLVTIKAIEAFAKSAAHVKLPTNSQVKGTDLKVLNAIVGALTVTRPSIGTTDHLVITTNLNRLARAVVPVFASLIPSIGKDADRALSQVPQTPISLNAFVTHGALSKLTFDAGQFSKQHPFSLPIVASLSRVGSPISAPTGSTAITLESLIGLFTNAVGSSQSGHVRTTSPTPIASTGL